MAWFILQLSNSSHFVPPFQARMFIGDANATSLAEYLLHMTDFDSHHPTHSWTCSDRAWYVKLTTQDLAEYRTPSNRHCTWLSPIPAHVRSLLRLLYYGPILLAPTLHSRQSAPFLAAIVHARLSAGVRHLCKSNMGDVQV